MNRNVTILIIILSVLVVAGYLLWLRSRLMGSSEVVIPTPTPIVEVIPTPTIVLTPTASPSASPKVTPKVSPTGKVTPTKSATNSGTAQ